MTEPRDPRPVLNVAGRLTKAFLHSKLTPLTILAVTLFGALAVLFTPRTYNPEIVVPVVNIQVSRPGSDAQEMLHQVVRPLEALVGSLSGVDHTYGVARNDAAMVTVRFKVGEDEERSLVKVYNQVNGNLDRIPPGTRPPLIQSMSLYDVPIVTLTLSADGMSPQALRGTALHVLTQLRGVKGVGKSWVQGASPPAVRVELDPARLAAYDLSVNRLARALRANNITVSAGSIVAGNRDRPVRVAAQLTDPAQVGRIVVGTRGGRPVFLKDVARVTQGPRDEDIRSVIAYGLADPEGRRPGRGAHRRHPGHRPQEGHQRCRRGGRAHGPPARRRARRAAPGGHGDGDPRRRRHRGRRRQYAHRAPGHLHRRGGGDPAPVPGVAGGLGGDPVDPADPVRGAGGRLDSRARPSTALPCSP